LERSLMTMAVNQIQRSREHWGMECTFQGTKEILAPTNGNVEIAYKDEKPIICAAQTNGTTRKHTQTIGFFLSNIHIQQIQR